MTTTAFQWLFDNATSIGIDKSAVVAQTVTRNNTVRSVSRGGQTWRFTVRMPDGMPWDENRSYIEEIYAADRYTVGNVAINNAGYNSWFLPYQGDSANSTGFVATATQGYANVTLTSSPSTPSGAKFYAGDVIQLNTGNVYTVANTVSSASNTVYLNRAVKDPSGSYALRVGNDVYWKIICIEMPKWTIAAKNQVFWDGNFVFFETTE